MLMFKETSFKQTNIDRLICQAVYKTNSVFYIQMWPSVNIANFD